MITRTAELEANSRITWSIDDMEFAAQVDGSICRQTVERGLSRACQSWQVMKKKKAGRKKGRPCNDKPSQRLTPTQCEILLQPKRI
jgi:hypothetical protein